VAASLRFSCPRRRPTPRQKYSSFLNLGPIPAKPCGNSFLSRPKCAQDKLLP
jgi:hypothetical protein